MTSLSDRVRSVVGELNGSTVYPRIAVTAGEVIGMGGVPQVDSAVLNANVTLGFIVPSHYDAEFWKIHTVDPFDYFTDTVKTQLLAKSVRQVAPRGGKIDYDIAGRLVGNWFQENTGGYRGQEEDYWATHLAIAYDYLDPSRVIVSMGNYDGNTKQLSVKGNSPDPANVSVATSLAKYDLTEIDYIVTETGERWDRLSYVGGVTVTDREADPVIGVILLELQSDGKLKVEIFPGSTSNQVSNFTNAALLYER